jgi:2-phosphoglycerate kinase
MLQLDRFVLLLGGVSGAGKTTAAIEISRRLGIPWLMVDDLRLAFQRSGVTLPHATQALYFFADVDERSGVWNEAPERLRDALIATGDVMAPAVEAIVENHLDQRHPAVVEGDGILPSLLKRPSLEQRALHGGLHAVFIIEPDEDVLLRNILARGRGNCSISDANLTNEARAKWLFGHWLRDEAQRFQLPVVTARPWSSLADRILQEIPGLG